MAVAGLVSGNPENSKENSVVKEKRRQHLSQTTNIDYPQLNKCANSSMPLLDANLKDQGFSKSDIKFTRQAWRPNTKTVYSNYLQQWIGFCEWYGYDPRNP